VTEPASAAALLAADPSLAELPDGGTPASDRPEVAGQVP